MIEDIFGILVFVSVNLINHVILVNILIKKNCKYREKLVDKLVEECTENIEEVKIISENKNKCSSCIFYIVLFSIIFIINIGIPTYFVYYKYMNHTKENGSKYDYIYPSKIININRRS